jgi:hypothetical protein
MFLLHIFQDPLQGQSRIHNEEHFVEENFEEAARYQEGTTGMRLLKLIPSRALLLWGFRSCSNRNMASMAFGHRTNHGKCLPSSDFSK